MWRLWLAASIIRSVMQTRPSTSAPTRSRRVQGARSARRQREEAAARQRRIVFVAGGAIVLLVVVLVAARLVQSNSSTASPNAPAPPALVSQVTAIDPATFEQVGRGTLSGLPSPVRAAVEKGASGLPVVTYVGAEYCPFCAGQRWALVAALGRFGTFSGLQLSHSASDDVYPNTPTFSFVNSTYSSPYVEFSSVELQTNVRSGNSYTPLQTPTPAQKTILQQYDAAPYVPAQSAGAIPFVDFAGQYVVSGASYDVGVLRGMTADQIAASLSDTSSAQAKAILGAANALTAAICSATGDMPADVCSQPTVQALEGTLAATAVPGRAP